MSAAGQWNPYFVAFARSKGRTPEEVRGDGRESGVRNAEFMGWIMGEWGEWARERGFRDVDEARRGIRGAAADFGAWLAAKWP